MPSDLEGDARRDTMQLNFLPLARSANLEISERREREYPLVSTVFALNADTGNGELHIVDPN